MTTRPHSSFMLVGDKHVGKTSHAGQGFERMLFVGRRVDCAVAKANTGVNFTHVEDFLGDYFKGIMKVVHNPESKYYDPLYQPPSISGYTIDAITTIVDKLRSQEYREKLVEYDAIGLDEFTAVTLETFLRWEEGAKEAIKKKKPGQTPPRFVTNEWSFNKRDMYFQIQVDLPRLTNLISGVGLSPIFLMHQRAGEVQKDGSYRPAFPEMPSRKAEEKAVRPIQEIYHVRQDRDFMCGFSTDRHVWAPSFYARNDDPDYMARSKSGIVAGKVPGNLWAVTRIMEERGLVSARRAPGREGWTNIVLELCDMLKDKDFKSPRDAAKFAYNHVNAKPTLPTYNGCSRTRAIRLAYQQASALRWHRDQESADPFAFDLPGGHEPANTSVSGTDPAGDKLKAPSASSW